MLDYKNVKIAEDIILVEKQEKYLIWQYRWRKDRDELDQLRGFGYHQAYVVDAGNKKMLESAMSWAKTRNYDEEKDRWGDTELQGIQHSYKNGQFELTLCDSADGSSQGGKLAFWNCIIKCPDGNEFLIGINADILLELLLNNTFINGKCQNKVYLGRVAGKQVGAFTENMPLFEQSKKDEAKRQANATAGSKYVPGDIVKTLTETQVYLGLVYCCGEEANNEYWNRTLDVYNKPQIRHVFIKYEKNAIVDYVFSDDIKKTKPKRMVEGHVDLDGSAYSYIEKYTNKQISSEDHSTYWAKKYLIMQNQYAETEQEAKAKKEVLVNSWNDFYQRDAKVNYID